MKVNVVLNPHALDRQPQEGQGTRGQEGKDCIMDTQKTFSGCGKQGEKEANEPRKD